MTALGNVAAIASGDVIANLPNINGWPVAR
jgi:hypothetical protein